VERTVGCAQHAYRAAEGDQQLLNRRAHRGQQEPRPGHDDCPTHGLARSDAGEGGSSVDIEATVVTIQGRGRGLTLGPLLSILLLTSRPGAGGAVELAALCRVARFTPRLPFHASDMS